MEGKNMNRREFLKKAGGGAAVAGLAVAGGFGGAKLEKALDTPSPEIDREYATYLMEIEKGNMEIMREAIVLVQEFQSEIATTAAYLTQLENKIANSPPAQRGMYEVTLRWYKDRMANLQAQIRYFADPIHLYYETHKDLVPPELPPADPSPETPKPGRMSF